MTLFDQFWRLAEEKIQKSYNDGDFEELPGLGQPLQLTDYSGIPEELRMAYHILNNAGYIEDDRKIRKELMTINDLLKNCTDEEDKQYYMKQISEKLLKYNAFLSKRRIKTNSSVFKRYQTQIERKLL